MPTGVKKRGTPPTARKGQAATGKSAVGRLTANRHGGGQEKKTNAKVSSPPVGRERSPVAAKAAVAPASVKAKAPPAATAAPIVKPAKTTEKAAKTQIEEAKAALKSAVPTPVASEAKASTAPRERLPAKPRAKKISVDVNPNEAASALVQKWNSLYKKAEQIDSKPYNMKAVFEEKTAIVHKVLGWGYILANRNDRLEVLFKDGIKYLISNYKP